MAERMAGQALLHRIKVLIIDALNLEDITPDEIGSDEPLFGPEGLGLDSIDGLELGMALRKAFRIDVTTVNEEIRQHFASVRRIAAFVADQHQAEQQKEGPQHG